MCFGPSTLGAGAKTRLESRIKKFTPHCVYRVRDGLPQIAYCMPCPFITISGTSMQRNTSNTRRLWYHIHALPHNRRINSHTIVAFTPTQSALTPVAPFALFALLFPWWALVSLRGKWCCVLDHHIDRTNNRTLGRLVEPFIAII